MSSYIIQQSGTGPGTKYGTEALVDSLRGSTRCSVSPIDYSDSNGNLLGHYAAVLRTGNLAATMAANAPLVSMRWTSTTSVAVIESIRWSMELITQVTTEVAGFPDAEAIIARNFTVVDSGGTATTPVKMRSAMGNSAVGDLRVSTTAALTAGTRTLDGVGFAFGTWPIKTSLASVTATYAANAIVEVGVQTPTLDLYKWDRLGGHPPVLAANEGLILRQSSAGPATGTYNYIFTLEWAEVALF